MQTRRLTRIFKTCRRLAFLRGRLHQWKGFRNTKDKAYNIRSYVVDAVKILGYFRNSTPFKEHGIDSVAFLDYLSYLKLHQYTTTYGYSFTLERTHMYFLILGRVVFRFFVRAVNVLRVRKAQRSAFIARRALCGISELFCSDVSLHIATFLSV